MKAEFFKFALPIGMGLIILVITTIGLVSTSCDALGPSNHCKSGYPLWCSSVNKCCPAGYPYWCDGNCRTSPCPTGTVTVDSCVPE